MPRRGEGSQAENELRNRMLKNRDKYHQQRRYPQICCEKAKITRQSPETQLAQLSQNSLKLAEKDSARRIAEEVIKLANLRKYVVPIW